MIDEFGATHRVEIDALVADAMPCLRAQAAQVLADRKGQLLAWMPSDFTSTWLDRAQEQEGEANYRRGYYHGYGQAMADLRSACKQSAWNTLAGFFDGVLRRWRCGEPRGFALPPLPPRPLRGTHVRAAR